MNGTKKGMSSVPRARVAIVEEGGCAPPGWLQCEIGRDIEFDTAGLASYCFANPDPLIFDAFVLAAAIDFCDRVVRRPSLGWGRVFEVSLPVHDPDRWSTPMSEQLVAAVSFLTGDHWHFEFHSRHAVADVHAQGNFEIPDRSAVVLPFSEGLDSRMVAALLEHDRGRKLVRVRLGSSNAQRARGATQRIPFAVVPYRVRPKELPVIESSARSRGFKFTMLSGIAAHLSKASEIAIPESGQGALGPALVPVGQAYEDFRNHPRFASKMAAVLTALFGSRMYFTFPRLWHTKGETLREYARLTGVTWSDTRSCWQQSRQVSLGHRRRQCGCCAACMLRRLSVHAAELVEDPKTYVWENLRARTFEEGAAAGFVSITQAHREYAIAGTLHLDHMAALSDAPVHSEFLKRAASQLASVLGLGAQDAEDRLYRLLKQHNVEWQSFVESLGAESFVTKWIPGRTHDAH